MPIFFQQIFEELSGRLTVRLAYQLSDRELVCAADADDRVKLALSRPNLSNIIIEEDDLNRWRPGLHPAPSGKRKMQ